MPVGAFFFLLFLPIAFAGCSCNLPASQTCPSSCSSCLLINVQCNCWTSCSFSPSCSSGYVQTDSGFCTKQCTRYGIQTVSTCTGCKPNYYGPQCKQCPTVNNDGVNVCNSQGTQGNSSNFCDDKIGGSGQCRCASGWIGSTCQYSRKYTCNNHGTASVDGKCTCDLGWAGPYCSSCLPAYSGPTCSNCATNYRKMSDGTCQLCTNSGTNPGCNNHGTCQASGNCTCSPGYAGANCNACDVANFYYNNYPTCTYCNPAITCNGRGICSAGECLCIGNNYGPNCNNCPAGYATKNCTECPGSASNPCGSFLSPPRGTCYQGFGGNGTCSCAVVPSYTVKFRGTDCMDPIILAASPLNGPTQGGTLIRLNGYGFGASGSGGFVTFTRVPNPIQATDTRLTPSYWSDTVVSVLAPAAFANQNITLWLGSRRSNSDWTFVYDAPTIYTFSSPRNTSGGVLTIDGSSFSAAPGTMTLNSQPLTSTSWTHQRIVTPFPPGAGVNLPFVINVPNGVTNVPFSYDPPKIISVTSPISTAPTTVTITGYNFGPQSVTPVVLIQGKPCTPIQSWTYERIVCTSPSTRGTGPTMVTIAGQSTTENNLWQTLAPTVTGITVTGTGCVSDPGCTGCVKDCPPGAFGEIITISGTNFGDDLTGANVTIGGLLCANPVLTVSHTQLRCTLPAGFGIALPVCVNRDNQTGCANLLSYASPYIVPNSLRSPPEGSVVSVVTPNGTIARVNATGLADNNLVAFDGSFLLVTTNTDVVVTFGPKENPTLFSCPISQPITNTLVTCNLGYAVGGPLFFQLVSGSLTSNVGVDELYFPLPTVLNGSIGLAPPNYQPASELRSDRTQGELIMFNGTNFGTNPEYVTVRYGPPSNRSLYSCSVVNVTMTTITCFTAPGTGKNLQISVTVGPGSGGQTVTSFLEYTYSQPPVVYSVSGCSADPNNANRTIGCPTSGRWDDGTPVILTIEGDYLGTIVTVGGGSCLNVREDPLTPQQRITCQLPAGAGFNSLIVVARGPRFSNGLALLDYAIPIIYSVSGCIDNGNNTEDCDRAGGTIVTLTGKYFGQSNAAVVIGGVSCGNVVHDLDFSDSIVTCVLPAGVSQNRAVLLIQAQGESSKNIVLVSYRGCGMGRYSEGGTSVNCTLCSPGFYADVPGQQFCLPCSPGLFAESYGSDGCNPCPSGQYAPAQNSSQCLLCEPGRHASSLGAATCRQCDPGTYSPSSGLSDCISCPSGSFQNERGSTNCSYCSPGFANPVQSQQTCSKCSPGFYTNTSGSVTCVACFPGFVAPTSGLTVCSACTAGTFAEQTGQPACLDCPKGTFSLAQASTCTSCLPSEYQDEKTQSSCKTCQAGYISATGAAQCERCPAGRFAVNGTVCSPCGIGEYQPTPGSTTCIPCAAGFFSATTAALACLPCPVGAFSNSTGATHCLNCPYGTFGSAGNAVGSTSCTQCSIGRYSASFSVGECIDCSPGTFSNETGASVCTSCPPGTYTGQTTVAATECLPCMNGTYAPKSGSAVCDICPKGKYSSEEGASTCIECDAGYYQDQQGQSECIACPIGYYTGTNLTLECLPCGSGKFGNDTGLTICFACPQGTFSTYRVSDPEPPTNCTLCPVGFYGPIDSLSDECFPCPSGKYTNTTGASSCSLCDIGTYQNQNNASSCEQCPPGTFQSATGQKACAPCTFGEYQPSNGSSGCLPCPAGKYQASSGGSACSDCLSGTYNPTTSQTTCILCDAGTYSNETQRTTPCDNCPSGRAQKATGASECPYCLPGYVAVRAGLTECVACPQGQIQNTSGGTECSTCSPGTFQESRGQQKCNICPIGQYSQKGEAALCALCDAGRYAPLNGSSVCRNCEPGRYQTQAGEASCLISQPGFYSLEGAANQIRCPPGTVNPEAESSDCPPCALDSATNTDQTKCLCNVGFYDALEKIEGQPANNSLVNCRRCPRGSHCTARGVTQATIETAPGWWRPLPWNGGTPDSLNQLIFYRCLLPFHCVGGVNSTCGPNRDGPICAACLPGYRSSTVYSQCSKCPERSTTVGVSIFIILIVVTALVIMYYIVLRNDRPLMLGQEERDQDVKEWNSGYGNLPAKGPVKEPTVLTPEARSRPNFLYKMKIILGFFQICSNISVIVQVPWPSHFATFVRSLSFVNLDFIPWQSVGCAANFDFFTKFLVVTITPIVIMFGLFLFFFIPFYLMESRDMADDGSRRDARLATRRRFWKLSLFTLFLMYPGVSSIVLSMFICRDIQGESHLVADFTVICFEGKWNSFIPIDIIMTIVYPIGIPVFFFFLIWHYRERHHEPGVRVQLGFLYEAYHKQAWYFEMFDLAHKLALTSLIGFFANDWQLPVAMVVIGVYTMILLCIQPYLRQGDDRLHLLSQVELSLIVFCGYILSLQSPDEPLDDATDILLSIILILLTVALLIIFIVLASVNVKRLIDNLKKRRLMMLQDEMVEEENLNEGEEGETSGETSPAGGTVDNTPGATITGEPRESKNNYPGTIPPGLESEYRATNDYSQGETDAH